jgi:hypothetical protein
MIMCSLSILLRACAESTYYRLGEPVEPARGVHYMDGGRAEERAIVCGVDGA